MKLSTPPVFLVGSVRSGTTLLRLMLDHHPQIAFPFEFEFAVEHVSDEGEFPPLDEYHAYLAHHRVFQASQLQLDASLDYPSLVRSFLVQRGLRAQKPIVGATIHHHFHRVPYIWPDARFIHLLRDGRDVARSCIAMGWAGNFYRGVELWMNSEQRWAELSQQLPGDRFCEVRYEDLIADPVEELTRICDFVGCGYDPACLDYVHHSRYGIPDAKFSSQWKTKMSAAEVQLAESRIGDMLLERGYELSDFPPRHPNAAEIAKWNRQNQISRAKYRVRRYGLPLFMCDVLARRCQLRPLLNWCRLRINEIDARSLR